MIEIDVRKRLKSANGDIEFAFKGTIGEGEFVTIFGASGAGKTTLLRMIAGLTAPDSGSIVVNGEVWFNGARKINLKPQKRRVGFVFQDYALFPNMSVRKNIEFALAKNERQNADRLLDLCGLNNLQDQKPAQLSGGQKQRVAFARALAPHPKVLLLDEPLSALDNVMRHELQNELLALQKTLCPATLLVSHDLSEVFRLSSKTFVIEGGRIVKSGAPSKVFSMSSVSNKFRVIGDILSIEESGVVYILSVLVGGDIVKVAAAQTEIENIRIGDRALIASKAFNPIIIKID
ncbi:MAG: ATP-binding cassette domain-containing protein [Helicobacteraceae bacterium]|jgi:molybdate transport system ATP-binding protein|nr:ATP-binding cassette domain-containing protein [Helicobacteraceae bacterium]